MEDEPGQFVVQKHLTPEGIHWDFMLSMGDVLWTWRIGVPPNEISRHPISIEKIADHPLRFLTYEGPVQNNTAAVQIADSGDYRFVHRDKKTLDIELNGTILYGRFLISHLRDIHWTIQQIAE